jgi:hypothetical protein
MSWHSVPGHGLFEAHPSGRVRRIAYAAGARTNLKPLPHEMRQVLCRYGSGQYLHVCIQRDGERQKMRPIHRIIAYTFLGETPVGCEMVCHRDGNPLNNSLSNLYWGSHDTNIADGLRHGSYANRRRVIPRNAKLTENDVRRIKALLSNGGVTHRKIAAEFNVAASCISMIASGKNWRSV